MTPMTDAHIAVATQSTPALGATFLPALDSVVRIAAAQTEAATSTIRLVESKRPLISVHQGMEVRVGGEDRLHREATRFDDVLVVCDTLADPRFNVCSSAAGAATRFFAGAPLLLRNGARVGSLCVFDRAPRPSGLTPGDRLILTQLAELTAEMLLWPGVDTASFDAREVERFGPALLGLLSLAQHAENEETRHARIEEALQVAYRLRCENASVRSGRLLVADYEQHSRAELQGILEGVGYDVRAVSNAAEAITAALQTDFDAILLSEDLPDMDAATAARFIRALPNDRRGPPLVALDSNRAGLRGAFRSAGFDELIERPALPEAVLNAVDRAIAQRRPLVAAG